MFWPSGIFILACMVYAGYSFYSIKGRTGGWEWHVCQWVSVALFLMAGFLFGRQQMGWHSFGEVMGTGVLGVPAYVFFLHYLLKRSV